MEIVYTTHFDRAFKKLSEKEQAFFFQRFTLFEKDIFSPELKTHKLHGPFCNFFSFSLNSSERVVFQFDKKQGIIFLYDIGSHKIYEA